MDSPDKKARGFHLLHITLAIFQTLYDKDTSLSFSVYIILCPLFYAKDALQAHILNGAR